MRQRFLVGVVAIVTAVLDSGCSADRAGSSASSSSVQQTTYTTIVPEPDATPNGLAIGFGSVWVVNHPSGGLDRIDPTTDRSISISLPGHPLAAIPSHQDQMCMRPWIGGGRVWVGGCSYFDSKAKPHTWVVDPATNQVVGVVPAYANEAAFIGRSAWLTSKDNDAVLRFDLNSLKQTGKVSVAGVPVAAHRFLWIVKEAVLPGETLDLHTIVKVDPRTDKILDQISVPDVGNDGRAIAAYGALWVFGVGTGTLLRFDLATEQSRTYSLPGDEQLSDGYEIFPAAGSGSIWVRVSDDQVDRVDPQSGRVTAMYPGDPHSAGMLADGFGSLWVANVQAGTVWRETIQD